MNKLRALLILLGILGVIEALSQDAVFSQYYSSSLYLNPALAGIEKQTTIGANYRSQWNKLVLPFNTFQMSFVQPLFQRGARRKHMGGVGMSILNDTAGPSREFSSQAFTISAAYNIYLGHSLNHTLSFALQAGASQQKISYDNLRWTSQYKADQGFDPTMPGEPAFANTRVFRPLFGSGIMWSYRPSAVGPTYYHGVVMANLLRSQSHFAGAVGDAAPIYKLHGGVNIPLSNSIEISPNYLFLRQGMNQQLNAGMYASYATLADVKVTLGAWYRFGDAFIMSGGIATKKVSVALSYDNNVASMGRSFGNANAYELSMTYRLPGKNNFKRISSPLI